MADQFQIPQRTPPTPQFQPPTELVNSYLNRPTPSEVAGQGLANSIGSFADYKKYQLSKQLAASEALGKLFEAGGPYAVQQYGAPLQNLISGQPQQASSAPAISPSMPTPQPQPQQGTVSQAPTSPQAAVTSGISPAIQHSVQNMGAPDFTGHLSRINKLQGQMADVQNMGQYGRNQQQGIGQQITAEKAALDAEQAPLQYAEKAQSLANAQQQVPMEINKAVAGEVGKQGENATRVGQLRGLFTDLKTAVSVNKPSLTAGLSGKLANATGGNFGSMAAADLQNVAAPLTAALNYELTKRFNESEAAFLMNSMVPKPIDQPAFAQKKMERMDKMISALEQGDEKNIKNVASTIATGHIPTGQSAAPIAIPKTDIPTISDTKAFNALPSGTQFKDPTGQVHRKK